MDADDSGVIDKTEFCRFFVTISEGVRPLQIMETRAGLGFGVSIAERHLSILHRRSSLGTGSDDRFSLELFVASARRTLSA